MIEVIGINKTFGDRQVLKNVSFEFQKGITNLVIGESGCGKTTLLKLMVGLHAPDTGKVLYDGRDFTIMEEEDKQLVRQEIGMMFQGGALFDSMTVEENIAFPLGMFTEMNEQEKKERVDEVLNLVKLEGRNKLFPAELSGGMKKRAALARAIANNPRYLFCDEPNSGLDPKTAIVIDQLIKDITEQFGITTVVITHDMNSVIEIGEKILFIHKGENWWEGNKSKVLTENNPELMDFVYASEFLKNFRPDARNLH
jgi:phospholipid/cholesterol/gamma-HCH transport system ATP-binding protein